MASHRPLTFLVLVALLVSLVPMGKPGPAGATDGMDPMAAGKTSVSTAPIDPKDEAKVPHYFGPYSNWANSPFTLPDVSVDIVGAGTGATAVATVGANGAVTGIALTSPGSGYTSATVIIAGAGISATAIATVTTGGVVTGITVDTPGAGYSRPVVTITGTATITATATAYGGIDALVLGSAGGGYTFPTVDFDMPADPNGVQAKAHALWISATGEITGLVIDDPGSGYASAPNVVIRDGTLFAPLNKRFTAAAAVRAQAVQAEGADRLSPAGIGILAAALTDATATATLSITSIAIDTYGAGYTSVPTVTISDLTGIGDGATATAVTDIGAVTAISLTAEGAGYVTPGGIVKFRDGLPVLCDPMLGWDDCTSNNLGQHIPIGVPDSATFPDADYYVIALVQHREQMNSSLPITGTLLREYVQLDTAANHAYSKHVPLMTDLLDGTSTPALMPNGSQAYGVDDPHMLGPIISATKDRPVRIVFYNLLPKGEAGDLFIPVDSTIMGSGPGPTNMMVPVDMGTVTDTVRNPLCGEFPNDSMNCFKQNRATLHLHGGTTPWISDGTPHQWITPANEETPWPQGVDVYEVPDMATVPGVPSCTSATDGCMTFYYTNQQSARLMFYHDHSWGITRLNVYAGEAAGYLVTDDTEKKLISDGIIPGAADTIPLIVQDRTFVPQGNAVARTGQLYEQDPTWDASRWGGYGNLWYHHVYMPAQNPGAPGGASAYGRWMYGPWFWPPATGVPYGPIANPYYDPTCKLDDPLTWQYQIEPFCEPTTIPGTPNISVGMEQFNDTPIVNGTAYPTTNLEPKTYRFRVLNAANDRSFNLQWYVADPTTASTSLNAAGQAIGGTEVALKAAQVAAAQLDPNVYPTPDTSISPAGPNWIQIGSEGGFLPAPAVVLNQPITWITDPSRFDFGNVDKHSLLLAPAERADVIVDFSQYAGQTLILYNDAPAAYPARMPGYDYYTGNPDLSPMAAPSTLPGYGPNTRTVMQVKIAAAAPAPAFNLMALRNAFSHKADGSGVFESGQNPIIVGQAAYNSAYGTSFVSSGWCNSPAVTSTVCDGMARISEQGGDLFGFNTLKAPTEKLSIKIEPKASHDEMNAASFDEFGRMTANLGLEVAPATPATQNVVLYPFVNPSTELIDATNLPRADTKVTPITMADGTQIWKITHNGVDTHPFHWHLYDVQILNRVTWDNIIIPTEASELGWKETIRVSPLEDTIIALRPVIPVVPFELPNSIRMLNPMMPAGATAAFSNIDALGIPTAAIVNQLVNFGYSYMYHCHILSHEEMDMMRPVSVAVPPIAPNGLSVTTSGIGASSVLTLTWSDNSLNETSFLVQRMDSPGVWSDLGSVISPLNVTNTHGIRSYVDTTFRQNQVYQYRVVALNTIGYGGAFMSLTVRSQPSLPLIVGAVPAAPSNLTASLQAGALSAPQPGPLVRLAWSNNATNATSLVVERCVGAGCTAFALTTTLASNAMSYLDVTVVPSTTYRYEVRAVNGAGYSNPSNIASASVPVLPAARTLVSALLNTPVGPGNIRRVTLIWSGANSPAATSLTVQRATTAPGPTTVWATIATTAATATGSVDAGAKPKTSYYYRVVSSYNLGAVRISNVSNVVGPVAVP
jgi:FtsP/CotA-like multicopper oxidase with cupredoxin domain